MSDKSGLIENSEEEGGDEEASNRARQQVGCERYRIKRKKREGRIQKLEIILFIEYSC